MIQGRVKIREKLSVQPEFHAVLLDASLSMTSTFRSIIGVRFRNSSMLIQQNELLPANDSSNA